MTRNRLEAFSDGVIAIVITVMVLELRPPEGTSLEDLARLAPRFLSYLLSFVFLAIYWNNHHHLLHAVERVDGRAVALLWLVPDRRFERELLGPGHRKGKVA